jgi:hypothetical protein
MEEEDVLKKYPGEWLLLINDEIVEHSMDIEDVLKLVDEKYPAVPEDSIRISKVIQGSPRDILQDR